MHPHTEVEIKYNARNVSAKEFSRWAERLGDFFPELGILSTFKSELKGAKDTFYDASGTVIRYRRLKDGSGAELTIKARHSDDTTITRDETEVHLKDEQPVSAFMKALGAKKLFSLAKDYVLYEFESGQVSLDVVLYRAYDDKGHKETFIEVEVGKSSKMSTEDAMVLVAKIGKKLAKKFKLGTPMNKSLFEVFYEHNKRYQARTKGR